MECYINGMLRARVQNGRLVMDEPTSLPEGTTLNLVVDDEIDILNAEQHAELNHVIAQAKNAIEQGHIRPVTELLKAYRSK